MFKRDGQAGTFESLITNHQLEALEPRVLLTTLVGGDVFEYIDSQGQTVRVVVEGDAIIELIGGDINNSVIPSGDYSNALVLGDLPGYIYQSALGRTGAVAGGLGGAHGVELRGAITPDNGTLNIMALATNTQTGNTWALNLISAVPNGETAAVPMIQLIEFDGETGTGHVRKTINTVDAGLGTTAAAVTGVVAAAFDIRPGEENTLYFVTQLGGTGGYELRAIDVNPDDNTATNDAALVDNSRVLVNATDATTNANKVNGIAFDQTGVGTYELVVSAVRKTTIDGTLVDAGMIERYSEGSDNFFNGSRVKSTKVTLAGGQVTDISGIAFKGDDASARDRYLYATTPEGLLLIDLNTGYSQFMGQLADPQDLDNDTPRGSNIGDVTWDADSINPFTGLAGVLVGVDFTTDELIYIDDRPRFATADIYAIYVSQTSENAKISIAVVPPFNPEDPEVVRNMQPFTGNIGSMRVIDISNDSLGDTLLISSPAGSGGVLIGALTEPLPDSDTDVVDLDLLPIVSAYLAQSIGVRPVGLDTDPYTGNNLSAGIYVGPSTVQYVADDGTWSSRLLGSNLDIINSLAVNHFGTIAAVDIDHSNTSGNFVADQLAFINGSTGKATSVVNIHEIDGINTVNLSNTAAIAYGYADLSQITGASDEELYAIIDNRLGTLDADGLFTEITDLSGLVSDLDLNIATVRSLAFGPGGTNNVQSLYILADPNGTDATEESILYSVQYTVAAGKMTAVTDITQINADPLARNLGAMTFDASGRLLVQDRDQGKYVQLNTTTGAVTELNESVAGSLRATVGGMAYDLEGDRILVIDNATSQQVLNNEGGNVESAALMEIKSGAAGQNIGSILIGGTVTGRVYFSGSVDTFYAGWIVTGETGGQLRDNPERADNFYVQGDIRNLVTVSTIGTNTVGTGDTGITYNSGVDVHVVGRLGNITGFDSGLFRLTVDNLDTGVSLSAADLAQSEIEYTPPSDLPEDADPVGYAFENFRLYNGTVFSNDSLGTSQLLGTLATGELGQDDIVRFRGTLTPGGGDDEEGGTTDKVDYLSVALMAGQVITIRLENGDDLFSVPIGVYDPDGRLIASEFDPVSNALVITADRPGLYTIAVGAYAENVDLEGEGSFDYILQVEGVGTVAMGGLSFTGNYHYNGSAEAITVQNGDLGAIRVNEALFFGKPTNTTPNDILVGNGNLRAIVAGNIGETGLADSTGLAAVVSGSIGLISAVTGNLTLIDTYVGGNIQTISGVDTVNLDISVDGGIGNIYAGSLAQGSSTALDDNLIPEAGTIRVNADNQGQDGIIDLIDVEGDLGTETGGGIAIITGPGGNVRYIRVGGTVYQDSFFSSGDAGFITGSTVNVVDDSGAAINLQATNPGLLGGGTLQVTTYGIRGSGGSVVVKVQSTTGLNASSNTGQNSRPAEISEIVVSNAGNDLIIDSVRHTVTSSKTAQAVSVNITGSNPLDVFSIVGGGFDVISNKSGGELVNITARSIGLLYAAGSIGVAKQSNGTAVLSRNVIFDTFPFSLQRNAVTAGDFGTIRSDQAVGNIIADTSFGGSGTIGAIYANNDGRNNANVFEGIVGPVYTSGDLFNICIGEGVAISGTGYMAQAGIFVKGILGTLTNQGLGSDIRGTVAATGGIDQILLTGGGSIIDTQILVVTDLEMASYQYFDVPTLNVGSFINKISLSGNGGIIGSLFQAGNIGDVTVKGGFGIFNSTFSNLSQGSMGNFYADGFGFRGVTIRDGVSTGNITAGQRSDTDLSISSYTASVRASEFDPNAATTRNDLATALDNMALDPDYTYTAGVIYDLYGSGTVSLGTVKAFHIESSYLAYANSIEAVISDENTVGLQLTTGKIKNILTGSSKLQGDLVSSFITVSGNIGTIKTYGNITATDIITSSNGTLDLLAIYKIDGVGGNLQGGSNVTIAGRVNTIDIQGDIDNSTITVLSGSLGSYSVGKIILGGNLHGTLELHDDVNSIFVAGSLGEAGDKLVVDGSLKTLVVGGARGATGVEMGLELVVLGDLGNVTVNGIVTGSITVEGSLKKLSVNADAIQAGSDIVTGDINVTETISSIALKDGNLASHIFVGRDLTNLTITNGDFTNAASATSMYGAIKSVKVDGEFAGLVQADNGDLGKLTVGGDMTADGQILAKSAGSIAVTGQIIGGAVIEVEQVIKTLTAGYVGDSVTAVNLAAGGITSLTTRGVRNVNDGDLYANLTLGNTGKATKISVAGNFGGTSEVQGDLALTVRGNVDMDTTAGESLIVTGDLTTLGVTGDLNGAIFVKGAGSKWTAGSLTNAILTSGQDVKSIAIKGAVSDSLVQVGLWMGDDLAFATVDGEQDLGEQSRRAILGAFTADSVSNSIIASGGDITKATVKNVVSDSSFSAGWSVGSLAIVDRMGGELDTDVLRSGDDRALLNGNLVNFTAGDILDSYLTAGVDSGVGGDFSNPSLIYNDPNDIRPLVDGGGVSTLGTIKGDANAGTRLVADSGIVRNNTLGGAILNTNVAYNLADLEGLNTLPASVGTASNGSPLVYTSNGLTVTITLKGDGTVDARDVSLADGILDGLVITGTTSKTTITITTSTPGAVDIGRIFTSDDAQLKSLSFDGSIVGDETADLDVWFDGGIDTLSLAGFGNPASVQRVTGSIGGNITTFNLGNQSAGILRISGTVRTMNVGSGSGDPLQLSLQEYAGRGFSSLTIDGGDVYAYENGRVYTIDPQNDNSITSVAVTDGTLGEGLTILGMDIDPTSGNVYAVSGLYNQNPTLEISSVSADLQGLAVRGDGAVFAVQYDADLNVDQLVRINPATGAISVIGTLQDVFSNNYGTDTGSQVMTLAFRGNTLLAILTDRDAASGGTASVGNDVTIAAISTTANSQGFVKVYSPAGNQALPPVILGTNGGEAYTGMAVDEDGNVFAIRDDSTIVQIDDVTGLDAGSVNYGGLSMTGIGFDIDGNLIALDSISSQLYVLDMGGNATALSNSTVAQGLTAFAIGSTNDNGGYITYAYDDVDSGAVGGEDDELAFYTNPGLTPTLGVLDPATGLFIQNQALTQDAQGTPLQGNILDVVVDATNNRVKVLTEDGQIFTYLTDGSLDLATPVLTLKDANGAVITDINQIDFDATGRLLGVSSLGRQLVVIDTTTGEVSPLTEPGSLRGLITAFAVDTTSGVALAFNDADDQVSQLAGFTQASLGGITAGSIGSLTLGDGYSGRISALGNMDKVTVNGDFAGALAANGTVKSLTVNNGDFDGVMYAQGDITKASFKNANFNEDGLIWSDGTLSMDVAAGATQDGLFNGQVVAANIKSLTTKANQTSSATIIATHDAASITLGGDFDGSMDLASVSKALTINGTVLSGGQIIIHGNAATLTLKKGAEDDTLLAIEGSLKTLAVSQQFAGVIGVRNGIAKATFQDLNGALVSAGLDTQTLAVKGNVTNSVISLGTWFGEDFTYNTYDDVITGGMVKTVSISGNYRDSVTAVGVLPSFNLDGFTPGVDSNYAFVGNDPQGTVLNYDAAEAGGLLRSVLGTFSIKGEISSSSVPTGRIAALTSADEITKVTTGQTGSILNQRVYDDPYGPLQSMGFTQLTNNRFEIILSEPINTASIIVSIDDNGDDLITTDSGDQVGSVIVYDSYGRIVNNVTLSYSTRTINGVLRGIITGIAATPFDNAPNQTISIDFNQNLPDQDGFNDSPVLMDRSGLRSALRQFNGDPLGTLFDYDNDGLEG